MNDYGYHFFDSDVSGFEEYDIDGDELVRLYEVCFKYCNVMSLKIANDKVNGCRDLEPFRISKPDCISDNQSLSQEVHYYKLCPELLELLPKISNNMFGYICGWGYNNPEDPTFYREDGSVFFKSEIHEGEILLMPTENEDVSQIVSNPKWTKPDTYRK